jgi:hypothetical protein
MERDGFWSWKPIEVRVLPNGKFEIIDGHHRFLVAKELNIPLWYVTVNKPDYDIVMANQGQTVFSNLDWVTMYSRGEHVKDNKPDEKTPYSALLFYHNEFGVPISSLASLMSGKVTKNAMADLKNGNFKFTKVITTKNVLATMIVISVKHSWISTGYAIDALTKLMTSSKKFSNDRFLDQVRKYGCFLEKQVSRRNYLELFVTVYNYHSTKKNQISITNFIDDTDEKFR